MGRRALRKLDPAIDFSRHYRVLAELPERVNAATLFDRQAPLEIEVGSGKGLFLSAATALWPDHNFLGTEIAHKYARLCAAKLAKAPRANGLVIDGDAVRLFHERLADDMAAAVHVYFPDPWWKKRHKKRRVLNETLLRAIQRVLVPGGRLHFWTDVEEYYHSTLELIAAVTTLQGPFPVPETPASGTLDYRTHFERRTRLLGLPVYRAEYGK